MSVGSRNVDRVSASGHAYHSQWTPLLRIPIVDGSQVARASSSWARGPSYASTVKRCVIRDQGAGWFDADPEIRKPERQDETATDCDNSTRSCPYSSPRSTTHSETFVKQSALSPRCVFRSHSYLLLCEIGRGDALRTCVEVSSAFQSFGRGCPAFGPGMRWVLFERAVISIRGVW
jgi:hypothetical protein